MTVNYANSQEDLTNFLPNPYNKEVFILTDSNCTHHCLPLITSIYKIPGSSIFTIKAGETNKDVSSYIQVIDFLATKNASRNAILLNIGGGIITDLGGFVASTYKRGIQFINIPTSLMAMVDAAHGGKVGINHNHLKNYIGSFSDSQKVIIYPDFLKSLPTKELLSGFAEVLKHGLIADKQYWNQIKSLQPSEINPSQWMDIIQKSIYIKTSITSQDKRESGIRKNLNFGHTIGHAFESWALSADISITHGHAVAAGMICEAYLSMRLNQLPEIELKEITSHLTPIYNNVPIKTEDFDSLLTIMSFDKKNSNQQIHMSLLHSIGNCHPDIVADEQTIRDSLDYYLGQYHATNL